MNAYDVPVPDDLLNAIEKLNFSRWCARNILQVVCVEGIFRLILVLGKAGLASSSVPIRWIGTIRTSISDQNPPDLIDVSLPTSLFPAA